MGIEVVIEVNGECREVSKECRKVNTECREVDIWALSVTGSISSKKTYPCVHTDNDTAEGTLLAQSPFVSKPSEKANTHTL